MTSKQSKNNYSIAKKNFYSNPLRILSTIQRYNDFKITCQLCLKSKNVPQACRAAYYSFYTLADHYIFTSKEIDLGQHSKVLKILTDLHILDPYIEHSSRKPFTLCNLAAVRKCADYDFVVKEIALGYQELFNLNNSKSYRYIENFFNTINIATKVLLDLIYSDTSKKPKEDKPEPLTIILHNFIEQPLTQARTQKTSLFSS